MLEEINNIVKNKISNDDKVSTYWCKGEQFQVKDSKISMILIITQTKSK